MTVFNHPFWLARNRPILKRHRFVRLAFIFIQIKVMVYPNKFEWNAVTIFETYSRYDLALQLRGSSYRFFFFLFLHFTFHYCYFERGFVLITSGTRCLFTSPNRQYCRLSGGDSRLICSAEATRPASIVLDTSFFPCYAGTWCPKQSVDNAPNRIVYDDNGDDDDFLFSSI